MSGNSHSPHQIGPYTLKGTIGEGAFSVVKLAFDSRKNTYYACKIVPKKRLEESNLTERFKSEIRINQQLNYPGIVSLIDVIKDKNNYYIVMEFCPNGELFQYIVDRGRLTEEEAKPKMKMILESVKHIHELGIAHRDIKPENILIDQYGLPKMSDFGLSRFVRKDGLVSTPCGSPCYASPECVSGEDYDGKASDIWSCGVVLFAMVTGQLPWTKRNMKQLFEQIRNGDYTIPNFLSKECRSMIRGLMDVNLLGRMTIDEALDHPWLEDVGTVEIPQPEQPYISMKRVDDFFEMNVSKINVNELHIRKRESLANFSFDKTYKVICSEQKKSTKKVSQEKHSSFDKYINLMTNDPTTKSQDIINV